MIKVIDSSELKTDTDLVCTSCGIDHLPNISGDGVIISQYHEGKDFVFETETEDGEEWCICMECKIKLDSI